MPKIKAPESTSKRDLIITAAVQLFKEKGYNAASMRDLAGKVGVEAASLYNHISSKGEILQSVCQKVSDRFTEKMDEIEKESISTIEKIEKLLRFHVRQMVENYEEVYVCDRDWRNMDEPFLSGYRESRRSYRKRFGAIVQQGIDKHEIKSVDANTAVMIFLNAIAAVDQWHRIIHKVESQQLEDNIVSILINGLKK